MSRKLNDAALASKAGISAPEKPENLVQTCGLSEANLIKLIISVSSDRGLCGGIHSGLAKNVRNYIFGLSNVIFDDIDVESHSIRQETQTNVVCVGDKTRNILNVY